MAGLHDLWKRIEEDFEQDETLEPEAYLGGRGLNLPRGVQEDAAVLLQAAFDETAVETDFSESRYRILERIDSGGQSEIYRAERADGMYLQTVVIKLLARERYGDLLREQLRQEMQLLAELNHPGVVNMLDGGLTGSGQPWMVLEYIAGETLDRYCRQHGPSLSERVRMVRELCDALAFIHRRGVVHLDLKPGNVLVRTIDGVAYPVLIDFGIALRAASGVGETDTPLFGTRGFAAPEQLAGGQADRRSDIYALGMVLAQLLVGDGTEPVGLLSGHKREAMLARRRVPPDLQQIVRRCTQREPDRRYPSAEALRTDLDAWLNDLPLVANRRRPAHVFAKWSSRHPWIVLAAVAVLLAGAVSWWKYTLDIRALQEATLREKNQSDARCIRPRNCGTANGKVPSISSQNEKICGCIRV